MSQAPTVFSGCRAIFKINGKRVAFASNVSYRISHPHQPIQVLGRYSVAAHEPIGYDISFNCSVFRVLGKSAVQLGIQPTVDGIISAETLMVEIVDRKYVSGGAALPAGSANANILKIKDVKMVDRSGVTGSRDVMSETWDFVGIIADDEAGEQDESLYEASQPYTKG